MIAVKQPVAKSFKIQQRLDLEANITGTILVVLALFGFVWLCYTAGKKFASLPMFVRRHPQICLHTIFWMLVATLWISRPENPVLRTLLIGLICVLPFALWRLGYMMFTAQREKIASTRFTDHLFYIYPVWGGTDTPYGKGLDYLSANEARDDEALAKSQLAALKLFVLAALWTVCKGLLGGLVFAEDNVYRRALGGLSPGMPRVGELFANPAAYPIWLSWVALYLELVWSVLALATSGHVIIGWLRLFGFNVFRNTYKPLLAETVVEFWNRYYYYFKELLVNFFFFPTFSRYFKTSPRFRVFAAVFMAAFVGNAYYHWLQLDKALATANFEVMWAVLQSRLFYCFLLAFGIWVSMLREQQRVKRKVIHGPGRRAVSIFGVWTFFSIIHIWAEKGPASFAARMKFFLGLIGLG